MSSARIVHCWLTTTINVAASDFKFMTCSPLEFEVNGSSRHRHCSGRGMAGRGDEVVSVQRVGSFGELAQRSVGVGSKDLPERGSIFLGKSPKASKDPAVCA